MLESSEEQPVAAFAELFKGATLPPPLQEGLAEPRILRHYLLLHDEQARLAGGYAGCAILTVASQKR